MCMTWQNAMILPGKLTSPPSHPPFALCSHHELHFLGHKSGARLKAEQLTGSLPHYCCYVIACRAVCSVQQFPHQINVIRQQLITYTRLPIGAITVMGAHTNIYAPTSQGKTLHMIDLVVDVFIPLLNRGIRLSKQYLGSTFLRSWWRAVHSLVADIYQASSGLES